MERWSIGRGGVLEDLDHARAAQAIGRIPSQKRIFILNFEPLHSITLVLQYSTTPWCFGAGLSVFIFSFPGVHSAVPPITIELPEGVTQTRFNLERWAEILTDPALAKLPNRIETDRHGHILMSPPPAFRRSRRQGHIIHLLNELLPDGKTLPECPLSTADGVKAIDVAWLAAIRPEITEDPQLLTRAPEICVEVFSPANSPSEINEKRILYFNANATEVWVCALDGSISFFVSPDNQLPASSICPAFPNRIP
jgi:Uma2 family endonuclease